MHRAEATPTEIAYDVFTQLDEVETIAAEWEALLEISPCNRSFSSPIWYIAACRSDPEISPYVVVARRGGGLSGILPLAQTNEGTTLTFSTNLADYNDIVAAPDDLVVTAGLLHHALSHACDYDKLVLTDIRLDSNCVRALPLIRPVNNKNPLLEVYASCPCIRFSSGYDEYLHTRSKAFQKELRHVQRKAVRNNLIVKELEPTNFPASELPGVFLSLHLNRQRTGSCFELETAQSFITEVLPPLFAKRKLRAFALFDKERMVAINLCMLGVDSLCYWNGGFLAEAGGWSPGKLLIDAGIKQSYAMGLKEYDFLRGSEDYKLDWANGARQIYRIEIQAGIKE
jgi:CelD/BcsL family acetyltransferase involved in cellulose biosynthesis